MLYIFKVFLNSKKWILFLKCFLVLGFILCKTKGEKWFFCLNYFQIYVFHLQTLTKGNQLFLKVLFGKMKSNFLHEFTFILLYFLIMSKRGRKLDWLQKIAPILQKGFQNIFELFLSNFVKISNGFTSLILT